MSPEGVGKVTVKIGTRIAFKLDHKKCPYCHSSDVNQHPIGYSGVSDDLRDYRGDMMGFRNTGEILMQVATEGFRAT